MPTDALIEMIATLNNKSLAKVFKACSEEIVKRLTTTEGAH